MITNLFNLQKSFNVQIGLKEIHKMVLVSKIKLFTNIYE